MVNPGEAQTTPSIKVKTYYDNLLDSVVDKITSRVTVSIVARVFTERVGDSFIVGDLCVG